MMSGRRVAVLVGLLVLVGAGHAWATPWCAWEREVAALEAPPYVARQLRAATAANDARRLELLDAALRSALLDPGLDDLVVETRPREGCRRLVVHRRRRRLVEELRLVWRPYDAEAAGVARAGWAGLAERLPRAHDQLWESEAARRLQRRLRRRGWRAARVYAVVRWRADGGGVLELHVDLGPRFRIAAQSVSGDVPAGVAPPKLVGLPWDEEELDERLRAWLVELRGAGYRLARGRYRCQPAGEAAAHCRLELQPGPRVELRFTGNQRFYVPDLLDALALNAAEPLDRWGFEAAGVRLRRFYQREGHPLARIDTRVYAGATSYVVHYRIQEGPALRFVGIALEGVADPEVRARILEALPVTTSRLRALVLGLDRNPDDERLQEAAERALEVLRAAGYLEARLLGHERVVVGEGYRWVLRLEPGIRYRWGGLQLGAWAAEAPADLRPGAPADPRALRRLSDRIVTALRDRGYLDALVVPYTRRREVGILEGGVRIWRGPRYRVAAVRILGAVRTREGAIRERLPLAVGAPARQDLLYRARRNLLAQQVFYAVDTEWRLRVPALAWAVAEVRVRERAGGRLEAGALLTTAEGVGFDLKLVHNRLFGDFRRFSVEGSATYLPEELRDPVRAQPFRLRWQALYEEPWRPEEVLFLQGLAELSRNDPDYDWFNREVGLGWAHQALGGSDYRVGYRYTWFSRFNVLYPELDRPGTDRMAGPWISLLYHAFDQPFDPRSGWGSFQEVRWVAPVFGGDFTFLRYEASLRGLARFGGRLSGFAGLRGGWIYLPPGAPAVPRAQRFRLGGNRSLRGYVRDSVSPWRRLASGEAVAVGGQGFLSAQLELRFGLTEAIELALFQDGGWVRGFDGARVLAAGYGAGLLYHTPAGPLRLDYGRKWLPLPTDPSESNIHVYILGLF